MEEMLTRILENLSGRLSGPFKLRFVLQPALAAVFAIRDGLKDARQDRPAYFWTIFTHPAQRDALLREGWKAVAKIFIIAALIDGIYQYLELRWFYPGEALMVAFSLACIPYLLIRGPVNRIARRNKDVKNS